MHDPRFDKLAHGLVNFSTKLGKGDRVLIDAFDIPPEMTVALIRAARAVGAVPFVQVHQSRVSREMALGAQEAQLDVSASIQLAQMKKMEAYIAVRGGDNITELSDVPPDKMKLVSKKMKPVLDWRVKKTRWCVLRWPSPSMAQSAGMSTEAFEKFFFDVCTLDYAKMKPGMQALKAAMEATDKVEIKGPGTDLRFSIKGIKAIPCGGSHNIPDGEVFTAPVRNSVQGVVTYNAPTIYQGTAFDNVRLEFKDGRSSTRRQTTRRSSTPFSIATPARATSASSPSASIRTSCTRCGTFCSTRKSTVPSTSRPANAMRKPKTATARRSTGIW